MMTLMSLVMMTKRKRRIPNLVLICWPVLRRKPSFVQLPRRPNNVPWLVLRSSHIPLNRI